jgi:hypothetical protein
MILSKIEYVFSLKTKNKNTLLITINYSQNESLIHFVLPSLQKIFNSYTIFLIFATYVNS